MRWLFPCWLLCASWTGCDADRDGPDADGCDGACAEDCANGDDDDGNGDIDCLDAACAAICPEQCDNGVDDNADWLVDCGDPGCASTCDADGDTWVSVAAGGEDCDDTDASVYPGSAEIYHDGLDNDCDPLTVDDDEDADGVALGVDCDDVNASVFPGAPEVCGDGLLNDCAATSEPARELCYGVRSLATADYRLDGSEVDGLAGIAVASAGDSDDDGNLELILGAQGVGPFQEGAAYRVEFPLPRTGDLRSLGCELTGVGTTDWLGSSVATLDNVDGEAGTDVGVGVRYENWPGNRSGAVYVLGPSCTSGPIQGSAYDLSGLNHDEFGTSFSTIGDLNLDGRVDLAVGMPQRTEPINDAGAVSIFLGPIDGPRTPEDAYAIIAGDEESALLGNALAGAGDLDADGIDDFVIGAPYSDATGVDSGAAVVVLDVIAGETRAVDHLPLDLGREGDQFGTSLAFRAGDLSGDGRSDLLIGSPLSDERAIDGGAALIIDNVTPVPTTSAVMEGESPGDELGYSLVMLRDVDGDDQRDIAVGARGYDVTSNGVLLEDAGAVFVWFGPISGSKPASSADIVLQGEAEFDFAGAAIGSAADIDGDALYDLVIGAPYHDGTFPGAGRVYLLTFGY